VSLPRLPRFVVWTAVGVVVIGLGLSFLGAWRTGVSWDESYHVVRLRNYLDHGWYLLDQDLDGNRPGSWEHQQYVYGPVAALLLHGWTALWGGEGWGQVSASAHAYALRHLGVALMAAVGVAATAVTAGVLTRSRSWALLAAAVLVTVPTWTGHAMFNVKDIPVATGYTLMTMGCTLLVIAAGSRRPIRARIGAAAAIASGLTLAIGTRPGIWPGLALAAALTAAALLLRGRRNRSDLTDLAVLIGAGLVAYVVLLAVYPAVFAHPVTALTHSVSQSADFGDTPGRWWYLPLYLGIELPTGWLIAGAVGTWIALRRLDLPGRLRRRGFASRLQIDQPTAILLLVGAQAFTLPVLAIVHQSNVYTGIRQFLFAAPGLAILVTIALGALIARLTAWGPRIAVAGLALPLVGSAMLFPYVYSFESAPANALVPMLTSDNWRLQVQTDYWRTSVRELAPQVPAGAFVVCSPILSHGDFLRRSIESNDDCGSTLVSPLAAYDDTRRGTWDGGPTEFVAVRQGNATVGHNCVRLGEVTRRLWWRELTMSTVSRCDLVLGDDPGPITFDGDGGGGSVLLGGWTQHPSIKATRVLPGGEGQLGFNAPHPGTLRLTAEATGIAAGSVTLNGTPLTVSVQGDTVTAEIPAAQAASWQGRLVFGFRAGETEIALRSLTVS
jgi:hypothetical protein